MWKKISALAVFLLVATWAVAAAGPGPRARKTTLVTRPPITKPASTVLFQAKTSRKKTTLPPIGKRPEQDLLSLLQKLEVVKPIVQQAHLTGKKDILKYLIQNNIQSQIVLRSLLDKPTEVKWALTHGTTITDTQIYYEAVRLGNRETVNLLCEYLKPSAEIKYIMFYYAVNDLYFDIAQDLLDKFSVDINTLSVRTPFKEDSVLLGALVSMFSSASQIEFLLKNGANPNSVLKNGNTIYFQLLLQDRYTLYLKVLQKYGAVLEGQMLERANLVLHEAINDLEQTRVLIEAGADPNYKKDGLTPLERIRKELVSRKLHTDERSALTQVMHYYESLPACH